VSQIGIGILSFAHGHANIYCQQISRFDDAKLIAAWDDNERRGRAAAEKYGMKFCADYGELLRDDRIDAVIVTSETNRHAELAIAAARAGKHILCQKPMALTLADCDAMAEAADAAGVTFAMAFQMRCDPANQKMKELVDSGAVGRVGLVRRRHCISVLFHEAFFTGDTRWHIEPDKNMGMFMDDAVHAADWFHWMLGRPTSVIAEIDNLLTDIAPDDTGVAVYRFAGGEMGILLNSSVTWAGENTTEIYGDKGVIVQNYGDGPSCQHAPPDAVAIKLFQHDKADLGWQPIRIPIPASQGERIAAVPRPFIDCLKQGTAPNATAEDGRVSVEMMLGAYRAAKEGRRVRFPLD